MGISHHLDHLTRNGVTQKPSSTKNRYAFCYCLCCWCCCSLFIAIFVIVLRLAIAFNIANPPSERGKQRDRAGKIIYNILHNYLDTITASRGSFIKCRFWPDNAQHLFPRALVMIHMRIKWCHMLPCPNHPSQRHHSPSNINYFIDTKIKF